MWSKGQPSHVEERLVSQSILRGLVIPATFTAMESIFWQIYSCCIMKYILPRRACFTLLVYSMNIKMTCIGILSQLLTAKLFSESKANETLQVEKGTLLSSHWLQSEQAKRLNEYKRDMIMKWTPTSTRVRKKSLNEQKRMLQAWVVLMFIKLQRLALVYVSRINYWILFFK